jgi:hypothetical protein
MEVVLGMATSIDISLEEQRTSKDVTFYYFYLHVWAPTETWSQLDKGPFVKLSLLN